MNVNYSFFISVLVFCLGLFFTIYLIYGRRTRKSLIGEYRPGRPGYDIFLRLISARNLAVSMVVTVLAAIDLGFNVKEVLNTHSSHSILIVAPIMVIIGLSVLLVILPRLLLGKKS